MEVTISGSADLDRFQYAYDRDGSPLYKKNTVDTTKSELYHANSSTSGDDQSGYDKLSRLTGFSPGTLTASGNNSVSGAGLDTISSGNLSALSYGKSSSGWEERLYVQHDANHNVTSITNASGTVQQRFVYDPYGNSTVLRAKELEKTGRNSTRSDTVSSLPKLAVIADGDRHAKRGRVGGANRRGKQVHPLALDWMPMQIGPIRMGCYSWITTCKFGFYIGTG